jgi:hypothetical protein
MVALAGVAWYDGVFHTTIRRSARRVDNSLIEKDY